MKKTAILLTLILIFTSSTAFANTMTNEVGNNLSITIEGSFKILNDTDADVQIYTGSGFVELNKGSSTSVTCENGKEIHKANKGKKGDVIFTVDASMCGKTVKLSKYL
jgi:catabolite regulation protein CreA